MIRKDLAEEMVFKLKSIKKGRENLVKDVCKGDWKSKVL